MSSTCMMPTCENQSQEPICEERAKLVPLQDRLIVEIREKMRTLTHLEMMDEKNGIENAEYVCFLGQMELAFQDYQEGRMKNLVKRLNQCCLLYTSPSPRD